LKAKYTQNIERALRNDQYMFFLDQNYHESNLKILLLPFTDNTKYPLMHKNDIKILYLMIM